MAEMSLAQLTDWVNRHDGRHEAFRGEFISRELHAEVIRSLSEDIGEIKESQRWAMRLIIGLVITNMVGLIFFLATQAPG